LDVKEISKASGSLKRKSKASSQERGSLPPQLPKEEEEEVSPYKVKKNQFISTKACIRENIKPNWKGNEKLQKVNTEKL